MTKENQLLKGLNTSQKQVVLHTDGPLLVLAGAGSGKTRVLTLRIARLVKEGFCKPEEILAVTFTNKAAAEMRERVAALVSPKAAKAMTLATFHSFGAQILREDGICLGLKPQYSILDEADRMSTIRTLMRSVGASPSKEDPATVAAQISMFKNASRSPSDVATDDEVTRRTGKVYKAYNASLIKRQSVDFDDLLLLPLQAFTQHPELLAKYQAKFRYICIDEYQDTNPVQMKIATLLALPHSNIMAVGDDDQSIYSWRGADSRNIVDFALNFDRCTTIILDKNYRSTHQILAGAYGVVERNRIRKAKQIEAVAGNGEPIRHFRGDDEDEESQWVAHSLAASARTAAGGESSGCALNFALHEHALLFRTNAMMGRFETALRQNNIRYRIIGGMSFFERKEIKDLIAYMRFLANPEDELSMLRVLKVPDRGIGKSVMEKFEELAGLRKIGLFESFQQQEAIQKLDDSQRSKVIDFVAQYNKYSELMVKGPMAVALRQLINEVQYVEHLKKACSADNTDPTDRIAHVEEIIHALDTFETRNKKKGATLAGFVQELALSAQDENERSQEPGTNKGVALMTIHKSKGLEFPSVYICGLDDAYFPSPKAIEAGATEEERRLFYVAMTRAKKLLTLTYARTKVSRGATREVIPCRFLYEIPTEHLERPFGEKEDEDLDDFKDSFFKEMQQKLSASVKQFELD